MRLRLMDVTRIMLRRPDGHPDRYGHGAGDHGGFDIDCLHWCLPGPIDVWNELLLQIMADLTHRPGSCLFLHCCARVFQSLQQGAIISNTVK